MSVQILDGRSIPIEAMLRHARQMASYMSIDPDAIEGMLRGSVSLTQMHAIAARKPTNDNRDAPG